MRELSAPPRGKALITGGCGFIGSNLADAILTAGGEVVVLDSLVRTGSERNLARLRSAHGSRLTFLKADIRDRIALRHAASDVDVIFHLAAQVAVTTSLADPLQDYEVNIGGTLNVLEAARASNSSPGVIFASTNKVYGDLNDLSLYPGADGYRPLDDVLAQSGISEERPLQFRTPYGCSKGASDQYVIDFGNSYGLNTIVLRMSCIFGPWQMGNEDQGWVAHFAHRVMAGQSVIIYGDGLQVRDVLFIDDAVRAYIAAWYNLHRFNGAVFNLGGGPANAVSVEQVLQAISQCTGRPLNVQHRDWREGDQLWYVSCPVKASLALGLRQPLDWKSGLERLLHWIGQSKSAALRVADAAS